MAKSPSLLIVDDDAAMRQMLESLFREQGFEAQEASSADAAIESLRNNEFDAVLSDIKMPGRSGIELVGELRRLRPETPVVLMTAFGSIGSAVDSMRAGAFDYITKPFEPDAVLLAVERAVERRALEEENRRLRRAVDRTAAFGDLVGESPAMREIFAMIREVAHTRSSVLITGESGTGKELVARTLHYAGPRSSKHFIPINCTAIPEGLLESELFGHVRGAFTGAHTSKRGLFEKASGGTLFLDEIGDMGLGLQSKLLRVLQDQEIRPVGSTSSVKVDVRIVTATNKDLARELEEGRFREDLFYRLNVIPIHIPPLRERRDDIAPLVDCFLRKHSDGGQRTISPGAMARLEACEWKGNARELENTIERSLALCDVPVLETEHLPLGSVDLPEPELAAEAMLGDAVRQQLSLRELEDRYVDAILELTGGNKVRAAEILGIDRKTIYRRAERRRRREATH